MQKITMPKIIVQQSEISVLAFQGTDYISLTDMAHAKESESRAADIIKNWLRSRYSLEFLGTWEQIHNPHFKVVEFDHFKSQAGLPNFVLSASEWIEKTSAIGILVKKGKYGGTYAHKDIAFHFGMWISPRLSNMENLNAVFIHENMTQSERLLKLNQIAIQQMKVLQRVEDRNVLKGTTI